jgi:hypothetical protein
MKAKRIVGNLLFGFVLVTVGFAIGKEVEKNRSAARTPETSPAGATGEDKVIVYYMHATLRCLTCNMVESMGEELVRTEFADAVKDGRLEWKAVDYQENDTLAKHYNVGGSMIVVVRFHDGKEVEGRRLDRVMELAGSRDEFMGYVRDAIRDLLEDKG